MSIILFHSRALRKDFIISKYVDRKYAGQKITGSSTARLKELQDAVKGKDIFVLLQAYAEKIDLSERLLESKEVRLFPSMSS